MKNMCEYPIIFDDRNLQSAGDQYSSEGPPISRGGLNLPRVNTTQNGSRGINQSFTVDKASQGTIIRQAEGLDENRIVLYKKGKQLGGGYYIIEISSNNSNLFIAAYDVESPESFLIELQEKKAQEIISEFKNDYELMACSLQVVHKRLILLNPVNQLISFRYRKSPKTRDQAVHLSGKRVGFITTLSITLRAMLKRYSTWSQGKKTRRML